ncbi:unnamed protein product [Ceutorhynchus assimilis]|uniref:acylaminoacyl-peptidase n=1 Tax=Ceutorhynchus assimilis TaxID=467358 RepID=A0A9N9QNF2_9CUCU|nr:unnamed protein product [Ceutorhynchus assimilis]
MFTKYLVPFSSSSYCCGMSPKLDKIVKTYKSLSQIPALIGAQIQSPNAINTTWSQRNLEMGATTKFNRTILLKNLQCIETTNPVDVSREIISRVSKSQKLKAVLREKDSNQILEIWQQTNLIRVVDLAALDVHGNVYTDVEFGAFEFSPDETKLLYVAEKKIVKSEPFYKRKKLDLKDVGDVSKPAPRGEEFLFEQDWGEQLVGKKQSVLAQYDIENDSVVILKGTPTNVCVAQPKYTLDGKNVVGVSYFVEPRKLGLIYCTNRPSTIFQLDFEGNYVEMPLDNAAVKSPIFTLDGNTIVWLERQAKGPHMACMALKKTSYPITKNSTSETIIDIVEFKKETTNNRNFFGIFTTGFPKRPWASPNKLFLNTAQKYTINSYVVDIETGDLNELIYNEGSQLIIDVKDDLVLALRRNFLVPDSIVLGKITASDPAGPIQWTELTPKIEVPEIQGATYKYYDFNKNSCDFNAIYLGPTSGDNVPLLVWPHGGPHSSFANYFFLEEAIFLALGYAILLVNYRGSTGSGNATVNFLLGKVGSADVQDCVEAVDAVLKDCPWVNPKQLALCGGSHGGFLVAHLSGQYPEKFKSVVARNPVIDIASMSIMSDIPDWCYIEAGYSYTQEGAVDDDALLKMRNASPLVHAHKVKAPTLLQIGFRDLRVPPQQGNEYYFRLKANGVKVQMNLYDDNHPLGTVPNEMDNIINTILWTEEHLGRD